MANSFFGKLNHLVKAHINDIISPIDEEMSKSRRKALARQDIRGGLEKDVQTLRKRIDDALEHQDGLQAKIDKLYAEIAEQDDIADTAVADGREDDARRAIGRIQQAQREVQMLEADLQEHKYVTQELITQVNNLDMVVTEAQEQETDIPVSTSSSTTSRTEEIRTQAEKLGENIVKQLDSTRKQLSDLIDNYTQQVNDDTPATPPKEYKPERRPTRSRSAAQNAPTLNERKQAGNNVSHPVDRRKVDDDYSQRLSRLSKPDDDK